MFDRGVTLGRSRLGSGSVEATKTTMTTSTSMSMSFPTIGTPQRVPDGLDNDNEIEIVVVNVNRQNLSGGVRPGGVGQLPAAASPAASPPGTLCGVPPASTGSGNSVAVTAEHRAWIERVAHRNAVALLVRELGATVIGEVSA